MYYNSYLPSHHAAHAGVANAQCTARFTPPDLTPIVLFFLSILIVAQLNRILSRHTPILTIENSKKYTKIKPSNRVQLGAQLELKADTPEARLSFVT